MPKKELHPLQHESLKGSDLDNSSRTIDTMAAARISETVVAYDFGDGRKMHGEVVARVAPLIPEKYERLDDPVVHADSLYIVRYPDSGRVGIATVDGERFAPGMLLEADSPVFFGRVGDELPGDGGVGVVGERQILGLAALSGDDSKRFSKLVSSIHGSLHVDSRGHLTIMDGHEEVDPETRAVIDKASLNGTHVSTAHESIRKWEQEDVVGPERHRERMKIVFGTPEYKPRDRFGNIQDRLTKTPEVARKMAEESMGRLLHLTDTTMQGMINDVLRNSGKSPTLEEAMNLVRSDSGLRIQLGEYLMKKIRDDTTMPDRVRDRNTVKHPNYPGYLDMTGDEYAAVLALSMLDGTFDSERSIKDPVEFIDSASQGVSINGGQHRLAAWHSLGLGRGAPEAIKTERRYIS